MSFRNSPLSSRWATLTLAAAVAAMPLIVFACSSAGDNKEFTTGGGGDTSGPSSSQGSTGGAGGGLFNPDAGMVGALSVMPANPILKVELPLMNQTIQFSCTNNKTGMPATNPTWSLDVANLGSIDANGLFTPSGLAPGKATVTCKSGSDSADTQLKVLIHAVDNSGVSPGDMATLRGGGPGMGDASWNFVYPYDQTVFPKGIVAPSLQMNNGSATGTAFYIHIASTDFEYEGFFNNGVEMPMSQAAWDALTNAGAGQSPEVDATKLAAGVKYGPRVQHWTLAPGKLHGVVYYNTYTSMLAGQTGAMMRIKGTSLMPEVLLGNCTVCHSISSDGSTAAAANHSGGGGVFDLTGGMLNPPNVFSDNEIAAFAGIYPKGGTVWVTNAEPNWGSTPGSWCQGNDPGNPSCAAELRQRTGQIIPSSGIEGYFAQSPCFAHDGTKIAFLDRSSSQASSLAMMDYDANAQKFTNYQLLAMGQPGRWNAWPAFTPDNKYVLYQSGTGPDLATWGGNMGKIFAVDTTGKQVVYLAVLNGDGYVPQGQRDLDLNFEPTIAPVASGGYFWVMFTSRRTYGNKLTGTRDMTKVLWASALDINAAPGTDFSHPAFYVPGQELNSGNSRGFWALDACLPDGQACQTGDECCNGFCEPMGNPPMFQCGPPTGMCSHEFESCKMDSDCCDATLTCIGGVCTYVPPK